MPTPANNDSCIDERPGGCIGRLLAIVEVLVAFAAIHVCYRAVKHFTSIGGWEAEAGTNFTPGVVMVGFTIAIARLCRRDFAEYGLTLKRWRQDLSLGLSCSLVEIVGGALGLLLSGYAFDASRPPDPHGTRDWVKFGVAAVFLVAGWGTVVAMVASRRGFVRDMPARISIALIAVVAAGPCLLAAAMGRSYSPATALWLFVGAGFGEEIFYRGYIQSRVDHDWGRPCRLLGFEFGAGLVVSSLLFGLVHALNTVDYFHGRFDFGWHMGLDSIFVGAFYGLIRARTGSVWSGAIMHGLTDILVRLPNVLRT